MQNIWNALREAHRPTTNMKKTKRLGFCGFVFSWVSCLRAFGAKRACRLHEPLSRQREVDRDGDDAFVRQRRVSPPLHRVDRDLRERCIGGTQNPDVADRPVAMDDRVEHDMSWTAGAVNSNASRKRFMAGIVSLSISGNCPDFFGRFAAMTLAVTLARTFAK